MTGPLVPFVAATTASVGWLLFYAIALGSDPAWAGLTALSPSALGAVISAGFTPLCVFWLVAVVVALEGTIRPSRRGGARTPPPRRTADDVEALGRTVIMMQEQARRRVHAETLDLALRDMNGLLAQVMLHLDIISREENETLWALSSAGNPWAFAAAFLASADATGPDFSSLMAERIAQAPTAGGLLQAFLRRYARFTRLLRDSEENVVLGDILCDGPLDRVAAVLAGVGGPLAPVDSGVPVAAVPGSDSGVPVAAGVPAIDPLAPSSSSSSSSSPSPLPPPAAAAARPAPVVPPHKTARSEARPLDGAPDVSKRRSVPRAEPRRAEADRERGNAVSPPPPFLAKGRPPDPGDDDTLVDFFTGADVPDDSEESSSFGEGSRRPGFAPPDPTAFDPPFGLRFEDNLAALLTPLVDVSSPGKGDWIDTAPSGTDPTHGDTHGDKDDTRRNDARRNAAAKGDAPSLPLPPRPSARPSQTPSGRMSPPAPGASAGEAVSSPAVASPGRAAMFPEGEGASEGLARGEGAPARRGALAFRSGGGAPRGSLAERLGSASPSEAPPPHDTPAVPPVVPPGAPSVVPPGVPSVVPSGALSPAPPVAGSASVAVPGGEEVEAPPPVPEAPRPLPYPPLSRDEMLSIQERVASAVKARRGADGLDGVASDGGLGPVVSGPPSVRRRGTLAPAASRLVSPPAEASHGLPDASDRDPFEALEALEKVPAPASGGDFDAFDDLSAADDPRAPEEADRPTGLERLAMIERLEAWERLEAQEREPGAPLSRGRPATGRPRPPRR